MTPQQFIADWQPANLSERSACQQHFCGLCELLGQPKPAKADPDGTWYTFERGVQKTLGGRGWADVWKRGHFGWEYKGKHKDLVEAYRQLLLYREDLENPPLLVVCDLDRFEVHTNFTNTVKRVYAFDLSGLADPQNLDVLRKLFTDPDALRPEQTPEGITQEAAERFAELADRLRMRREVPAERAAHFLMKLIFCMFGEDIGLLPQRLFAQLLEAGQRNPAALTRRLETLFAAMGHGGDFGADEILYFNGGLFGDADVIPLQTEEINILANVNGYDWASVEPSIFGTLFERTLDPGKRSQIGAHYTSRLDIETLLKPVLLAPLRREWDEVKGRCEGHLWPKVAQASRKPGRKGPLEAKPSRARLAFDRAVQEFAQRLSTVTVLDPACGSGNFLYVALHLLLDLEKEVISYAASRGLSLVPQVHPRQLAGLEINPYAQQLASVVLWIGYLQWMHQNGFKMPSNPVLDPIETIDLTDAILDLTDPQHPKEPEWPPAEFIVGNPPFLGGKLLRANLGDEYVDAMFRLWEERVPREADLCCYWFEKARQHIETSKTKRVGLLATQGIRGGANRTVLERIKHSGDIFWALSDREWILEGANVHVSMVGFDGGAEENRVLDERRVTAINANLTHTANLPAAKALASNVNVGFMGVTKQGPFDIPELSATQWLGCPNPTGRPNSDVLLPYLNGKDVTARPRQSWLIHFPHGISAENAAGYETPFEHARKKVKPFRAARARSWFREEWWELYAPRPEMRGALAGFRRYVATPRVAKYRLFVWVDSVVLPDCQLIVFAREDDYFFGILHSRVHEVWARAQGTQLRERESGFRYTPTTCFETFPLPAIEVPASQPNQARGLQRDQAHGLQPVGLEGVQQVPEAYAAIAAAARELDELRNRWLNPPEWTKTEILEFPGSVDGPWARYIDPAERVQGSGFRVQSPASTVRPEGEILNPEPRTLNPAIGTVRWPRTVPKDPECAESLKKRTLTNLYNQRPQWLIEAHRRLDEAVFAAYGWPPGISDEELLERLLELNLQRASRQ